MSWQDDLETVIARGGVERYRWLTSDENPDVVGRERYRAQMIAQADNPEITHAKPIEYPSLLTQAGNALEAAGRFVKAWWYGNETTVDKEELARRLAICIGCEFFDHKQKRCPKCGCFAKFKTRLATEHCPLDPPKW